MNSVSFKKIFFQTVVSTFLSFSTFAIGFLRVFYFSKNLSMEEFGILSLLLTLSAFLMFVFTLGSFQFLFKSVNEGPEASQSALAASLIVTVVISFVSIIITLFFIDGISSLLNLNAYKSEIKLTIIATATSSVMMVFLFHHYGLGRNNFQNFLQFLRGSLWVIVSIVFSLFFNLSLIRILMIINLCMCLILLISVPWEQLPAIFSIKLKDIFFSKLIRYCIPLFPYFAGVWGIPMILRTELNVYSGAKDVAIFSVAYTLMEIISMFTSTITGTLSPYFFAESADNTKPGLFYNIMLKYSVVCIMLIIPFVFMIRYDIILLVSSKKYLIAGDYIPLLILLPLLRIIIGVFEQHYLKASQTIYLGITYTITMLLSFVLSIILVPHYSILGAIYASLASYAFLFICLYVKQRGLVDFVYLNGSALVAQVLILWGTVYVLSFFNFSNFYKIIPLGMVALLSLIYLPILNEEEKNKILTFLHKKNE